MGGRTQAHSHSVSHNSVATNASGNDALRMFGEIEHNPKVCVNLSPEECMVLHHFNETHSCPESSRFIALLPQNPQCKQLGESISQVG